MTRPTRKRLILIAVGVLIIVALLWALLPQPVPVRTVPATRGPLAVIVEEEGETQVRDRYAISSPVAAFARRIELEVGEPVEAGQPLVRLEPPRSAILDPRARVEATGRIGTARAQLAQAQERARAAEAAHQRARAERERVERLVAADAATERTLEQTAAEAAQAEAALDAARAGVDAARAELSAARDALRTTAADDQVPGEQQPLVAPIDGRVLAVHRRSEGHVSPGEPLLEVGDPARLEVQTDVLSRDAVRIQPGTRVLLEQWGGPFRLEAVVTRVSPQAHTAVSALGVEERRVTVLADLVSPPERFARLGPGYRVLARFVIWEGTDVLQVPTGALFRRAGDWAVFVAEGGRARLRPVTIGHQAGLATQILDGLTEGEQVIVHPPDELSDGSRVRADQEPTTTPLAHR